MSKLHSQYKKFDRTMVSLGAMVYRGEKITTGFSGGLKWYSCNGLGTPSLPALLDSIDYRLSGTLLVSNYLRAQSIGSFFHCRGEWYVKTNFCGEHEGVGNWYVNLETGRVAHLGNLAAEHVGYSPRCN